jgi:hypothetical protein
MKQGKTVKELKDEISKLEGIIKKQDELIFQYSENYLMNMFNSLQAVIGEYSILLDPEPVKIKATYKNKSELFEVRVSNILCLISIGREKKIILRSPINSFGGDETRKTSSISISQNWELLKKNLDRIGFHLFPISKTIYVNVKYYSYDNNQAITKSKLPNGFEEYSSITVTKNHIEHFRERKENYMKVHLLQKLLVGYNLKHGIPLL